MLQIFPKKVINFDICRVSNLCFSKTTGLIRSAKILVQKIISVEGDSIEKTCFIHPCIGILIVPQSQKNRSILTPFDSRTLWSAVSTVPIFSIKLSIEKLTPVEEELFQKKYIQSWFKILTVRRFQNVLLILIHPETQTFFSIVTHLIFSVEVSIRNEKVLKEFSIEEVNLFSGSEV